MRRPEAASTQKPFHPLLRRGPLVSTVLPPLHQLKTLQHASNFKSFAFFSLMPVPDGATPPTSDVEKKTGSIPVKSFSTRILCRRMLPTIPLQPIKPTRNIKPPEVQPYPAG